MKLFVGVMYVFQKMNTSKLRVVWLDPSIAEATVFVRHEMGTKTKRISANQFNKLKMQYVGRL